MEVKCIETFKLLPGIIEREELLFLELQDQISGADDLFKEIEHSAYCMVEDEVDKEGKKVFSNETKRKSETSRRLEINQGYIEVREKLKALNRKSKLQLFRLGKLKRQFRMLESLTRCE